MTGGDGGGENGAGIEFSKAGFSGTIWANAGAPLRTQTIVINNGQ
jgi:hypothetical protein